MVGFLLHHIVGDSTTVCSQAVMGFALPPSPDSVEAGSESENDG